MYHIFAWCSLIYIDMETLNQRMHPKLVEDLWDRVASSAELKLPSKQKSNSSHTVWRTFARSFKGSALRRISTMSLVFTFDEKNMWLLTILRIVKANTIPKQINDHVLNLLIIDTVIWHWREVMLMDIVILFITNSTNATYLIQLLTVKLVISKTVQQT